MKKIFILFIVLFVVYIGVTMYRKRIKYLKLGAKGKYIRDLQNWYNENVVANLSNWNDYIPQKLNVTGVFDEKTKAVLFYYLNPIESYTTNTAYEVMLGRLSSPFTYGGVQYMGYGYAYNNLDDQVYKFSIK